MTKRTLAAIAGMMLALIGWAEEVVSAADQYNAVTYYRRAFEHLDAITHDDWQAILDYVGLPDAEPTPHLREVLSKATPVLNELQRAARMGYADFELDYAQGFELTLPHLSQMRAMTRLASARAQMQLFDGDSAGAAQTISNVYTMSGQLNNDRTLIGSLVGNAIFALSDGVCQAGLDRAAFSPDDAAAMHAALSELNPTDPFEMTEGVFGEREFTLDWIAEKYGSSEQREDPGEIMALFGDIEGDEGYAQLVDQFGSMSDEQFSEDLATYDGMMNDVVACFLNPDREAGRAELKVIEEKIVSGEYGVLVNLFMPSLEKVFDTMVRSEGMVRDRLDVLEEIAQGEINPVEAANAAVYYQRAIKIIEKEGFEELRTCFRDDGAAPDDKDEETERAEDGRNDPDDVKRASLVMKLKRAKLSVALLQFRTGADCQRCDFSVARSPHELKLSHDYIAGMHEGFSLLEDETARLIEAGEHDAAARLLGVRLRVMAHLSGDDQMLSPLVAHSAFNRVMRTIEPGIAEGWVTADHARALASDLDRMGRKDPFGYVNAIIVWRPRAGDILFALSGRPEELREHWDTHIAPVQHWSGDELMDFIAVYNHMTHTGREKAGHDVTGAEAAEAVFARLSDIIDLERLKRTRALSSVIAPRVAQREYDLFRDQTTPAFGRYVERMRAARSDLRHAFRLLRDHAGPPPESPAFSEDASAPAAQSD
jgi:hypothetical protein